MWVSSQKLIPPSINKNNMNQPAIPKTVPIKYVDFLIIRIMFFKSDLRRVYIAQDHFCFPQMASM